MSFLYFFLLIIQYLLIYAMIKVFIFLVKNIIKLYHLDNESRAQRENRRNLDALRELGGEHEFIVEVATIN